MPKLFSLFYKNSSIAPDYILCSKSTEKKFIEAAKKILFDWYGANPEESPDLTRIVNETNFLRLKKLLQSSSGTVVIGGSSNQSELFIAPTIVGMFLLENSVYHEAYWFSIQNYINSS